jgi:hypothetical protein
MFVESAQYLSHIKARSECFQKASGGVYSRRMSAASQYTATRAARIAKSRKLPQSRQLLQ